MAEPQRKTISIENNYLSRIIPWWGTPTWLDGNVWREWVRQHQLATICMDTLIMEVLQLKWKIRAREPNRAQELDLLVDEHTDIITHADNEGYAVLIDKLLQDALTIPFGGAVELVRDGDKLWDICYVDGCTLRPTLRPDYPVVQLMVVPDSHPVALASNEVNRLYLRPRPEIRNNGWGMAPPERAYLSLELLSRGDRYYANLLLDTPPAGILDLMDMEQESAEEWAGGFRELMFGTDAFKIPILYEHEQAVKFVPFGADPTTLNYDPITLRYAAIVTAGYGMGLRDVGLGMGRETLAGEIRQDQRSKRLGFSLLTTKLKYMFDSILPPELEWVFIEDDVEAMVALGRSRLTNAKAMGEYVRSKILTPEQARAQTVADGLITVYLDPADNEEFESQPAPSPFGQSLEPDQDQDHTRDIIGEPVPPSEGGRGEFHTDLGTQDSN